jgi:hypothetical protein
MSDDTTDEVPGPAEPTAAAVPPPPPPAAVPPPPPPPPPPPAAAGWAAPPPPGPPPGPTAPAPPAPAAPAAPGWAAPPPAVPVASGPAWRNLRGLTNAITVILGIEIAVAVFAIVAFGTRISVTDDLLNNRFDFGIIKRANDADDLVGAAIAISVLLALVLVILVIIWTFRAMKNNEALGRAGARFSPGWGIAGWLIPLANLVIPVLILQDLWRGSDASTARGSQYWRSNKGSALVGWYWAALILAGARFDSAGTSNEDYTRHYLEDLKQVDSIRLFGSVMAIAAAILGILMFRKIAERQEESLRAQQQAWGNAG